LTHTWMSIHFDSLCESSFRICASPNYNYFNTLSHTTGQLFPWTCLLSLSDTSIVFVIYLLKLSKTGAWKPIVQNMGIQDQNSSFTMNVIYVDFHPTPW